MHTSYFSNLYFQKKWKYFFSTFPSPIHQIRHLFTGFIGVPSSQPQNSDIFSVFMNIPFILAGCGACSSFCIVYFKDSGVELEHHNYCNNYKILQSIR